ncbi:hypothetical protein T12_1502 [Trichinella patagoniensis]|uniref:Uncharacterized protein n=1 Tax=Trichinella patagoniensis TaxID=990121 RepID=A0A0V0ZPV4_9BILA|nr:hypothetical protein T12_1502 [Trichinella patagoniensis]
MIYSLDPYPLEQHILWKVKYMLADNLDIKNCATIIALLNKEAIEGMGMTMVAQQPSAASEKDAHFREEEERQDEKSCCLAAQQLVYFPVLLGKEAGLGKNVPRCSPSCKVVT